MPACPNCREDNPERARFCLACGTSLLSAVSSPSERRKTVTILFCDVTGSTSLGERLDPESLRQVMSRYYDVARRVIERHGGTVEKFIGDAVMAVFGIPAVHEDDALRAVRAALDLKPALDPLNDEFVRRFGIRLRLRTSVHTGEVVAADPSTELTFVAADAVNVAARLEQAADPDEILVGELTAWLVRDAAELEPVPALSLKGKASPVSAFRLLGVTPGVPGRLRSSSAPMVGRERQLRKVGVAFARALAERSSHLVTILGSAGVGKSRLAAEFVRTVEDKAVVSGGRCLSYGEGITFWPVAEAIRALTLTREADSALVIRDRIEAILGGESHSSTVADRVLEALGLAKGSASAEELGWAVQALLEAAARKRPLVVVFDDIHWGEETFLDLVELVVGRTKEAPILVLCLARLELLERRPTWGEGKFNAASILLEPLTDRQSEQHLANLLGVPAQPSELSRRIAGVTEGNPLFLEELVAMLVESDRLRRENHHWTLTTETSDLAIPPTIQAVLAARLDQLPGEERSILECAAVVGRLFSRAAVTALCTGLEEPTIAASLLALSRKELLRPGHAEVGGHGGFAFRHQLVRDAAYEAQSKRRRAELHERLANWLEATAGDRLADQVAVVAYHLEQACRYRAELAIADPDLARRAADRLATAGHQANDRWDSLAAANLLGRARTLLPAEDPGNLELVPALVANLGFQGNLAQARELADGAMTSARTLDDRRLEARIHIERLLLAVTDLHGWTDDTRQELDRAIPLFEQAGDDRGLAAAWTLTAMLEMLSLRWSAMQAPLDRAIRHARHAGDYGRVRIALGLLANVYFNGPMPVPEAIQHCDEIERQAGNNRTMVAFSRGRLACLEAMRGNFARARTLLAEASSTLDDVGQAVSLRQRVFLGENFAFVEALAREHARAEQALRTSCQLLEGAGALALLSTDIALLADIVWAQGRDAEAEELTRTSERLTAKDDLVSQYLWRGVRAKTLARSGRPEEAERLAREAVELSARTDALNDQADMTSALFEVLRLTGRREEAVVVAEQAHDLYLRKGNLVAAAYLRSVPNTTTS